MKPSVIGIMVLVLAGSMLCGCQKGPPQVQNAHLIGTWIEIPDAPGSARTRNVPRPSPLMRKFVFKEGGNYTMTLAKPDGSGEDASKSMTGTWKLENGSFTLTMEKNTLGPNYKAWTPSMVGMNAPADEKSPPPTECVVIVEGGQTRLKRM